MTFSAVLGVFAALAAVLGLMVFALRALRRFAPGSGRARVPLEVVQRVSLGPKHGLAVVRVGEKVMVVSTGDGGVRPVMELSDADRDTVLAALAAPAAPSTPASITGSAQPSSAAPNARSPRAAFAAALSTHLPPAIATPLAQLLGEPPGTGDSSTYVARSATRSKPAPAQVAARRAPAQTRQNVALTPAQQAVQAATAALAEVDATTSLPPRSHPRPARPTGDFGSMLGVALSSATRLAVVHLAAGLAIGVLARTAAAQNPPTTQSTGPTTQAATTAQPAALVVPPAVTPPVVAPIVAPVAGQQVAAPTTPALTRPAVQSPSVARAAAPANPTPLGARTNPIGRPGAPAPAATGSANASSPALIGGKADSMISRLTPQMDLRLGGQAGGDGLRLSGTVGVVVMMGLLTLLPTLVLMMTGFTRILIVLNFLRQAIGTQSAPPAHLVAALSLILTGFVMGPTLSEVNRTAITPWMDGQIEQTEMLKIGAKPFRAFMLRQTREKDLATFVEMSKMERPKSIDDVPLVVVVSAFVTSELRTAFQIGFTLFLPFIIIDIVVSAVLMSMGMMMLPPAMIALPFKLLLFVLVDGWTLVIQSLVASFH